jgi:nitrogen fixation NifU-like protein
MKSKIFSEGYTERVMAEFRNPKNMGEIKDADGIGKVGNPMCGDIMECYIKIEKRGNKEIIKDIKIKTFGCVAAISTASVMTQMVKGKDIGYALKLTKANIAKVLGGLPPHKLHCSVLSLEALRKAIEDYKSKN